MPLGVATEWSFRRPHFERRHPRRDRPAVLARMAAVTAPILAVAVADDELGTVAMIRRTLAYYTRCPANGRNPPAIGLRPRAHRTLQPVP
jgi:predicted alpha/beta hydrolase